MKVFMIYVRDEDFYRLLPTELDDSRFRKGRVQVMAFPPLGIETLAPIVRQYMKRSDILKLLWSPFRKRTLTRRPELPAQMIDKGLLAPVRLTS